jgi:hypothetical protein
MEWWCPNSTGNGKQKWTQKIWIGLNTDEYVEQKLHLLYKLYTNLYSEVKLCWEKFFNGKLEQHKQCTFKCMWWHLHGQVLCLCRSRSSRSHFLCCVMDMLTASLQRWDDCLTSIEWFNWANILCSYWCDAVWLLFTGLVQMFCTSKCNILVL